MSWRKAQVWRLLVLLANRCHHLRQQHSTLQILPQPIDVSVAEDDDRNRLTSPVQWCLAQQNQCPLICGGSAAQNRCDAVSVNLTRRTRTNDLEANSSVYLCLSKRHRPWCLSIYPHHSLLCLSRNFHPVHTKQSRQRCWQTTMHREWKVWNTQCYISSQSSQQHRWIIISICIENRKFCHSCFIKCCRLFWKQWCKHEHLLSWRFCCSLVGWIQDHAVACCKSVGRRWIVRKRCRRKRTAGIIMRQSSDKIMTWT